MPSPRDRGSRGRRKEEKMKSKERNKIYDCYYLMCILMNDNNQPIQLETMWRVFAPHNFRTLTRHRHPLCPFCGKTWQASQRG